MSDPFPFSSGEFSLLVSGTEQAVRRVDDLAKTLVSTVRRSLAVGDALSFGLAGGWAEDVGRELEGFQHLLDRLGREVAMFVLEPGVPWTLYEHASAWTDRVGTVASGLAGDANLDETKVDDWWQGVAANAYTNTVPRQSAALSAVKTTTDELASSLTWVAIGIFPFWVAIASAMTALLVELIAEVATAATGVGAPVAAAGAGLSAAKAIAIISGAVAAFDTYLGVILGQCTAMRENLASNAAFPNGGWPHPSVDLSDGSLSDGDGTDWHLRY